MKKAELQKQLEQQKNLNNMVVAENLNLNKALETMEEIYEKRMDIGEKEIERLNVIIDYLETKDLK